ncbi:transporter, major facilitator family protein [Bifidobacterium reuteri DSM 23975]|uniref:Transporter, major facilitator family protein n=1 Tax=Bifidobacterium reuteri DSM 23975 TaxID=1437610 RepID=A0A087CF59_9BIFI|nr:MFS transporter [Bifidobacterium reuteri]KFI81909.1 transporter, major facilitator family protein [Bifidobacterium reuteri DSM 23975]
MNALKTRIGILSLSSITLSGIFIVPIIGMVAQAFPDSSLSGVQMIISASTLTALVGAWLTGKLASVLSRKTVALIGAGGILLFGMLPYFIHSSLAAVIAFSALMGVCLGFINNILPTLISVHYEGEQRQSVMGQQVAVASIGAMVFMSLAGKLATAQWYHAYLVYLFAAVVLIVCAFTIPAENGEKEEKGKSHGSGPEVSIREAMNGKMWFLVIAGFFFLLANNAYSNNLSLLVEQRGLGDAGTAGLVSTIGQLGGLLAGLCVGLLVKFVRNHLLMVGFLVEGLALLLLGFASNLPLLIIGSFLAGAGLSLYYAQAPFLVTMIEKPYLIPMGIAAMTTANALGGFASPVTVNLINGLFVSSAAGAMFIGAVIALAGAVALGVSDFQRKCLETGR